MIKKTLLITVLCMITGLTFADDHSSQLKKLLNRKIIFPESVQLTEKTSVEIQFEIMPDGCVAVTASKGNPEIINYIAEKITNLIVPYNQGVRNVFIYKFTFEKELSNDQKH